MKDRTIKLLLALIAAGLWANALVPVFKPTPALAQQSENYLRNIDQNITNLVFGRCLNRKLCDPF